MARILWASPKEVEEHSRSIHGQGHRKCLGTCLWGVWLNPKNHVHSGGVGRPARRKRLAIAAKYRKVEKKTERG